MRDQPLRPPTEGVETDHRQETSEARYHVGEYPSVRLAVETQCPDCSATVSAYQRVLEHEPCGCIRPFAAFADAAGCPDCGGISETIVIGRLYTCRVCSTSFDTPAYSLRVRERTTATPSAPSPSIDSVAGPEDDLEGALSRGADVSARVSAGGD